MAVRTMSESASPLALRQQIFVVQEIPLKHL
jgi:hypothetical protein